MNEKKTRRENKIALERSLHTLVDLSFPLFFFSRGIVNHNNESVTSIISLSHLDIASKAVTLVCLELLWLFGILVF